MSPLTQPFEFVGLLVELQALPVRLCLLPKFQEAGLAASLTKLYHGPSPVAPLVG